MQVLRICTIAALIVVLLLANHLRAERDNAVSSLSRVTRAYEWHLTVTYAKEVCGIEPVKKVPMTFNISGPKDTACFQGVSVRANKEALGAANG